MLRGAYTKRRRATLRRVLSTWRSWAPAKRTARLKLLRARQQLRKTKMLRVLASWHSYSQRRRQKAVQREVAVQHYRWAGGMAAV